MARKAAASPPKATRKRPLKRSTFSSDSLFGFGTPPSNNSTRQLSVPRFTLSQGTSPQAQVIDLTGDDDESLPRSTPPIPVPPTKKARRTSPSPMSNPPPRPRVNKPINEQTDREDGLGGALHDSEALWVDIHRPERPESLAVHARKVEDVRRWLNEALTGGPTGKLRRHRRILVLTGPSGSGKTATLRVLANEVNAEIVEWHASSDEFSTSGSYDYESATTKLVSFLERAGSYSSLTLDSTTSFPSTSATKDSSTSPENHHKILLLEDFPALSHPRARSAFHAALVKFAETAPPQASRTAHLVYPPLVIIISDAGLRAGDTFNYSRDDVLDIRTVLPPSLLGSHYVTQIKFNPIAATFMRKALASVLSSHLPLLSSASSKSKTSGLPKEVIDELIEAANGDIRSAIMGVQFACVAASKAEEQSKVTGRRTVKGKGKAGTKSEKDAALKTMFAAVTRREHALVLFHLLGKVFYNKRYGDPDEPGEPPVRLAQRLPEHLQEFERRPSKVDVSALHADSPVDASLFSLYVQQNYTQFCDDIDQCLGLAEALSEADGGMGVLDDNVTISAAQSQHTFQHIARSALIALPSPVPRRSQVTRKPAWFAARAKEREVEGSIEDTKQWLIQQGGLGGGDTHRLGYWDRKSVVLDVGGLLGRLGTQVPPSARVFSTLRWDIDSSRNLDDALGEEETVGGADVAEADLEALERRAAGIGRPKEEKPEKGYLSDDDIDDF